MDNCEQPSRNMPYVGDPADQSHPKNHIYESRFKKIEYIGKHACYITSKQCGSHATTRSSK